MHQPAGGEPCLTGLQLCEVIPEGTEETFSASLKYISLLLISMRNLISSNMNTRTSPRSSSRSRPALPDGKLQQRFAIRHTRPRHKRRRDCQFINRGGGGKRMGESREASRLGRTPFHSNIQMNQGDPVVQGCPSAEIVGFG